MQYLTVLQRGYRCRCRWEYLTDITNKEKVANMCRVKYFVIAGLFLVLSTLVISGMIVSTKKRIYGRMRWNDNDDRSQRF